MPVMLISVAIAGALRSRKERWKTYQWGAAFLLHVLSSIVCRRTTALLVSCLILDIVQASILRPSCGPVINALTQAQQLRGISCKPGCTEAIRSVTVNCNICTGGDNITCYDSGIATRIGIFRGASFTTCKKGNMQTSSVHQLLFDRTQSVQGSFTCQVCYYNAFKTDVDCFWSDPFIVHSGTIKYNRTFENRSHVGSDALSGTIGLTTLNLPRQNTSTGVLAIGILSDVSTTDITTDQELANSQSNIKDKSPNEGLSSKDFTFLPQFVISGYVAAAVVIFSVALKMLGCFIIKAKSEQKTVASHGSSSTTNGLSHEHIYAVIQEQAKHAESCNNCTCLLSAEESNASEPHTVEASRNSIESESDEYDDTASPHLYCALDKTARECCAISEYAELFPL